ncbi:ATP-binding protein [Phytohabitans sp. ZYX-F-186]|uniref:ATP-binding protein n=1 Tax=Phytohabitans maris TaxID=3071409 RepID=A0ABU0ZFE7_9ACTN|nr:ATP-binding protein [Phytohabitans sp. ZYX-F-186]MDQ7905072.1 ATP-binding protein [Phytohabitans sp. ZYX-F-186]
MGEVVVVGRHPDDRLARSPVLLRTSFAEGELPAVRRRLEQVARGCGLTPDEAYDWVIAVNELMANAIRHGGGAGALRVWRDGDLYCEVGDRGTGFAAGPYLAPRARPMPSPHGGMGLWIAQRMTGEMWIESGPSGTVVRIRTPLPAPERPFA